MFYADVHFVLMMSLNCIFIVLFLLFHTFNHITFSIGVYSLNLADAFSWVGSDIFIYVGPMCLSSTYFTTNNIGFQHRAL